MKLSELTTDETLNVLCEITPYVERILNDKQIFSAIGTAVETKGMTRIGVLMAGVDRLTAVVPMLLKAHRADVYGILAAVNRTDTEKIAGQRLSVTLAQIDDVLHDEELLVFFKSFGRPGQKASSAPSAPPPALEQKDTSPSSPSS